MKEFSKFMDLTGQNRTLKCEYHGKHRPHLEGKILVETDSELEVGVSLFELEIDSHKYDVAKQSLDINYKPFKGIMIAILPMTEFKVPKDIKEINVYDA